MNTHEVAAQLDDKSIKILRLLLREERHLNPGLRGTLTTPNVTKEYGWTNQTVLRRFRKLRDAGIVYFSDVSDELPAHDRYPRPPKAIERSVEAGELRDVLSDWDSRGTRSPAQLTDDLKDLDHRIDTTDDRHTNRTDALQSKLYGHRRYHATIDRDRARLRKPALYLALGALVTSLLIVLVVALLAPNFLTTVLLAAVFGLLGAVFIGGTSIYMLSCHSRSSGERDDRRTSTE